MIALRKRVRIAALLSPLLLTFACGSEPDEVETDQSAAVFNGGLTWTLLSVTKGENPPGDQVQAVIAFPGFTAPPGGYQGIPSAHNLGWCSGTTCNFNGPLAPWTRSIAVDTNKPTQTLTYTGQVYLQQMNGTSFARCFHFGLNTSTYKVGPVPVTNVGCPGGSPNDLHDPVTCDATTCTASVSVGGGGDRLPWKFKFGYKVAVPTYTGNVTITPDFYITNVYYPPPGQSSDVTYSTTTSVGTTTSVSSSFDADLKITAKGEVDSKIYGDGSTEITVGREWQTKQEDEIDVKVDSKFGYKVHGQIDGIDHNYDEIWLLIRPQLLATYTQPINSSVPPSMSWQFAPNQDGTTHAIRYMLYAGWLNGQVPMPDNVKGVLDYYSISPDYYPQILSADPLANGSLANPSANQSRYQFVRQVPYEPPLVDGNMPNPQEYVLTQDTTKTSTTTETNTYSVGVTFEGSASVLSVLDLDLKTEGTFTWENVSSNALSNGTTTEDDLTIGQPLFGYRGPTIMHVYEDTIYKTYVFSLDPLCGGSNPATYCNNGTAQQCINTAWGFEQGEAWAWSNSAETSSGLATELTHSGKQSLRVSASSDPALPASVNTTPCVSANSGAMDLRGKTYSAWVYVPTSSSSYAGTSCRLRAFDSSFHESAISTQAVASPITPGSWFQLKGTFPFTTVESQIYELTVDCKLPGDWNFGDASKVWYVDDISVALQ